jgi:hypothetical protein
MVGIQIAISVIGYREVRFYLQENIRFQVKAKAIIRPTDSR